MNYRTPELVAACLDSLVDDAGMRAELEIFIGDSESGDGSVEMIRAHIQERKIANAKCVAIGANNGFAYGNNFLLQQFVLGRDDFEFVYFLNPDAYIRPGAVDALADFLCTHERVGIAGSRLENPDGTLRAYGFNFPTPLREFFRGARIPGVERLFPASEVVVRELTETRAVDWVSGASFMMSRKALEQVGIMDDEYFLYYEEVDLMKRARDCGYEVWHVAESRVVHLGGQSTGLKPAKKPQRTPAYWYQSRQKFLRDHYGAPGAAAADILFLAGDVIYRARRLLTFKPIEDPPKMWSDYFAFGIFAARSGGRS